ncbi:hypothetical protein AAZX31_04G030300 [Glycine max]
MNIFDKAPVVDKDVFVAPSASVVWYGCVLRGDVSSIRIGSELTYRTTLWCMLQSQI